MKHLSIIFILFLSLCSISLARPLPTAAEHAAIQNRMYLKGMLDIFYIDKPNDSSYLAHHLDNASVQHGNRMDQFWDRKDIKGAHNLVDALLMEADFGGDLRLQYMATQVIKILNKPIRIYIVRDNDSTGISTYAKDRYGFCPTATNKAWPCANNFAIVDDSNIAWAECNGYKVPKRRDNYAGYMSLGTTYLNQTKKGDYGTFLHELMHTQDYGHWRSHLFAIGKNTYRYGADDIHYGVEVIPNMGMAYKEGMANSIRLMYDMNQFTNWFSWFARNRYLAVEKPTHDLLATNKPSGHCSDISIQPSLRIWLYDQLIADKVPKLKNNWKPKKNIKNGGEYGWFRIRDLHPSHIIHNEYIIAMIITSYSEHVSLSTFLHLFKAANEKIRKEGKYGKAIAELFHTLCSAGLPNGMSLDDMVARNANIDEAKPYLLPLAFVDFYTSFKSQSQEDFLLMFEEDKRMRKWTELYWGERHTIVDAMNPNKPKQQDLTTISQLLGVHSRHE